MCFLSINSIALGLGFYSHKILIKIIHRCLILDLPMIAKITPIDL